MAELEQLFTVGCPHPKHRAFLMTVYGAGLRLNEACHLQAEHLDAARQQIRVVQGKGRKDRYTLLSPRLLAELRAYWRMFRPRHWCNTCVLAVVTVVFTLLLVESFRYAHRIIGPRLYELESKAPP